MKKTYNKSEIMTRAWTIRRNENYTMSAALRKSWAQAKAQVAESLPELTGSENQIAWASDIRTRAYEDLTALENAVNSNDEYALVYGPTGIVYDSLRLAVTTKVNGVRIKSRLTTDDINAVRAALNGFFTTCNSGKIIDQRNTLDMITFHGLAVELHKTGDWSRSNFEEKWYDNH